MRGFSINAALMLMTASCLVPVLVGSLYWANATYVARTESLRGHMLDLSRALSLAIDRDLAAIQGALQVLALSEPLRRGDLTAFYQQATAVATLYPGAVVILADRTRAQVLSTDHPWAVPLPRRNTGVWLQPLFQHATPIVSGVFTGASSGVAKISVDVPIMADGVVIYDLGMTLPARHFADLLRHDRLPAGWRAGLADASHVFIARSIDDGNLAGVAISQTATRIGPGQTEAMVALTTLEGLPATAAVVRSVLSNWTVAIVVPMGAFFDSIWSWLRFQLVLTTALIAVSFVSARLIGLRIARAVHALVAPAVALGRGDPVSIQPLGLREANDVGEALLQASQERRRWQDAFRNAAYGVAITDARTNRQITVNPAYAEMHGMTEQEATGTPTSIFYPPDLHADMRATLQRADSGGHIEFDGDRLRKDGTRFPARVWLTTVRDEAGQPSYRIATVVDMTDRRRIEQQLVQALKMEAIGNLTGGIAHDFNNLLSVIILNLDVLEELVGDVDQAAGLIGDSLAAAASGARLTHRLLAFARKQTLAPSQINVNDVVEGMVSLIRRTLSASIVVTLRLAPDLWEVFADPVQLEASLLNLAVNARDSMPHGGSLSIETANVIIDATSAALHPELAPGAYATVVVSDTGTGMTEAVKARIFEPFFTTKSGERGTGLGLAMVFGFMRQSNGLITVYTEPDKGSAFRLYLPRSSAVAPAAPPIARSGPVHGGGETILVVEDNESLRTSLTTQLAALGYQVFQARDPNEALATLEERPVDLLLTDIVMPGGLDGVDLAREAIRRQRASHVILTSGFAEGRVELASAGLGASVRFLAKPFRRDELARMVRSCLDA